MLKYGFEENVDYVGCKKVYTANQYGGEKDFNNGLIKGLKNMDLKKTLIIQGVKFFTP